MDFLGIGGGEIVIILVIILLLWGPSKVVNIARDMGKTMNTLKKSASEITNQITKEVDEAKKETIETTKIAESKPVEERKT